MVIKAYGWARKYLATLPIHDSQREIASDVESTTFEMTVRPTYDYLQALLQQTDQIEVIEPQWVKDEMCRFAENGLSVFQ